MADALVEGCLHVIRSRGFLVIRQSAVLNQICSDAEAQSIGGWVGRGESSIFTLLATLEVRGKGG